MFKEGALKYKQEPVDPEIEYIKDLSDTVARKMKTLRNIRPKYRFNQACNLVFKARGLMSVESQTSLRSQIAKELGKRGARSKKKKSLKLIPQKQESAVPANKQRETLIKGAERLQALEEERAGQSYKDSDLE